MGNTTKQFHINAWIEGATKYNLSNLIRKFCVDNKLNIIKLESIPVKGDFLDKILFIERETTYFHISGDLQKMKEFKFALEKMCKEVNE